MSPGVQRQMCRLSMHSREDLVGLLRQSGEAPLCPQFRALCLLAVSAKIACRGGDSFHGYFRPITLKSSSSPRHCHKLFQGCAADFILIAATSRSSLPGKSHCLGVA
jgi:hypothetical protein